METLTTGQLAKNAGVNVDTVRYYERRGLIPEPPRSESGYRQYSPETATRIHFIKRAQELGFSLKEIAELLTLRVESTTICSDVQKQAEAKLADIEHKIEMLQRMRQTLTDLVRACQQNEITAACPIVEALTTE